MPSIAKFDTWQNAAGTSTFGTVVQVVMNKWHTETVSTSQFWVDVAGSEISITTRVANSSINLVFQGQSYKANTALNYSGFGLQLYRVSPHPAEISNPFTTWGASAHDNFSSFASNINLCHTDYPMLPAGSTVKYKLRMWIYAVNCGAYINYSGPNSRWGAVGTNSSIGYNNGSNIIATEIAP